MQQKIIVEAPRHEIDALVRMAAQDMRSPWEQVRYLVAQEARRRGLLYDPPENELRESATVLETAGALPLVQS